jgi:hypothetical protein
MKDFVLGGIPGNTMVAQGAYVVFNKKSGTALDLSGADHTSITGCDFHGGKIRMKITSSISCRPYSIPFLQKWTLASTRRRHTVSFAMPPEEEHLNRFLWSTFQVQSRDIELETLPVPRARIQ